MGVLHTVYFIVICATFVRQGCSLFDTEPYLVEQSHQPRSAVFLT